MALRIIYEGDEAVAKTHLPRAQNLMHKVREFVAACGAGVHGQTLVLDERSYTYCLKVGELESIYIFTEPESSYELHDNPFPELPDFYSGVTKGGLIRTDYIPKPDGSEEERTYLENFKPNSTTLHRNLDQRGPLTNGYQAVRKLAVTPEKTMFADFIGGVRLESEDRTVRRQYSQYRQVRPSCYSGTMQQLVQVVLGYGHIPRQCIIETDQLLKATIIVEGIQLVYDYRWHRTHGIVTAADKTLWIVEVSLLNGVIAMQLPTYPLSFNKLINSPYGDYAAAVEAFNGLPTGQGFPTGDKLKAKLADGTILRLATNTDLADFYALLNFSTACGWAFNDAGSECHNTGFYYHADGMQRSCHFRLDIKIGKLKTERQENEPIANGTAIMTKVSEGRLFYWPQVTMPQFKYHEPAAGGLLISADFSPSDESAYSLRYVCDATIHVYWAQDQLKLVNFYNNLKASTDTVNTNNYEDCMYVGSWNSTTTSGEDRIPAMFYTTDADDREEVPAGKSTIDTTGMDLGYFGPFIRDEIIEPQYSEYYRERWFRLTAVGVTEAGKSLQSSVVIPNGLRNGMVYAVRTYTNSLTTYKAVSYTYLTDPWYYRGFRKLFSGGPGGCFLNAERRVFSFVHQSGECQLDLADNGPWAAICDIMNTNGTTFGRAGSYVSTPSVTKETIEVMLYTGTEAGNIKLDAVTPGQWVSKWMLKSPDDFGDYQTMEAVHSSALGALQLYYDTVLNPTAGDQHDAQGNLMDDAKRAAGANGVGLYNFVGVP